MEGIDLWYTNADSLGNKLDEWKESIRDVKPAVVLVNEVKHKGLAACEESDYNLDMPEYEPVYNNIENSTGRGQLIMYKKGIAKQVYMKTAFSEGLFIELKLRNKDRAIIALVYRSESEGEAMSQKLIELIEEITTQGYSHIAIIGDFNYRTINWETMSSSASGNQHKIDTRFIDCIQDSYLVQHIDEPTRWRGADQPSLIDLVITNEENMISNLEYHAPLGRSDHAVITMKLNCYVESNIEMVTRKKYHLADYNSMRENLKTENWDELLSGKTAEEIVDTLQKVYDKNEQLYVPTVTKRGDHIKSIPIDKITADLIRKKTQMSRRVMNAKRRSSTETQIAEAKRDYDRARNKLRNRTRHIRRTYEQKLAESAGKDKNLKPVYAYMKRMSRTRGGIGDICTNPLNPKSCKTSNIKKKVKIFSDYFASVWTQEPDGDVPVLPERYVEFEMTEPEITPDIVEKKLLKLDTSKSTGPDIQSPKVLKEIAHEIAYPVAMLYRESVKSMSVPGRWKESIVSVLFKKGNKFLAGNYRPVSLTCILCKVLESILRDHFIDHMLRNQLLSDKQYGFIAGRSTTLQLLKVLDEWTEALDDGYSIDCVYMDFQKAFDTVPHKRLISKVKAYGFSECMLNWIESFITGRTQKVRIDGEMSEAKEVISGIPQGSVLGPFLFVLFVNDMPDLVRSMLYLFADDNKVYKVIKHPITDRAELQIDLNKLYEWSNIWLMKIHPEKLFGMEIGGWRDNPQYDYTVGPMLVKHSTMEKDIGVEMDNQLKFSNHIDTITKKANSKAGWLRRTFRFLTPTLFRPLYRAIVRSQLENAASTWSPHKQQDIDKLESVQMRATKMLPGFKTRSYEERLVALNLTTLKYRRIRGDMINVYKIMSGKHMRSLCPKMRTKMEATGRGGRNSLALHQERCTKDVRKHYFTYRVVAVWNTLPDGVVLSKTVDEFKRKLDHAWKKEKLKFDYKEDLSLLRPSRRK